MNIPPPRSGPPSVQPFQGWRFGWVGWTQGSFVGTKQPWAGRRNAVGVHGARAAPAVSQPWPRTAEGELAMFNRRLDLAALHSRFTLVPKVSAALWERTREAKLRFGGGRVSRGNAFDVVGRWMGDGVSAGRAFPKRCANFGNEMADGGALGARWRSVGTGSAFPHRQGSHRSTGRLPGSHSCAEL